MTIVTYKPDFIFIPYEVLSDDRLTLRQIRVLMAILSWRKKNTSISRVSRQMLSDRTGYLLNRISMVTTELEDLGWIEKVGNGGKSQWCEYQIKDIEETKMTKENQSNGLRFGYGTQIGYGTQFGDLTVSESETLTVSDSERGIDTDISTDINTDIRKHHHARKISKLAVRPEEVSEQTWEDFLLVRKSHRAPLTDTALRSLVKEANKAGLSLEDALEICCRKGWRGFDHEWLKNKDDGLTRQGRANRRVLSEMTGGLSDRIRKHNEKRSFVDEIFSDKSIKSNVNPMMAIEHID